MSPRDKVSAYPLDEQEGARAPRPEGTGFHSFSLICLMFPDSEFSVCTESVLLLTTLVNRGRHYYVGVIKLLTLPSKSCPAELIESDVGFL